MSPIALLACTLLAQDIPTFRTDAQFIRVDAQVLAGKQPVHGLTRESFRVFDQGQEQPITNFAAENQPLDLMLLLDVSSSTIPIEKRIKSSAREALAHLAPGDRVGVAIFYGLIRLVIEPTGDREKVADAIEKIRWGRPGTELFSNVLRVSRYLAQHARPESRRAVVILTDNKGFGTTPVENVVNALWESDVIFSALLFDTGGRKAWEPADVRPFVDVTGGEQMKFSSRHVPFEEAFNRIRERYVLLYRAPGGVPGEAREIRVELTPDAASRLRGVKIRARTGYRVSRRSGA